VRKTPVASTPEPKNFIRASEKAPRIEIAIETMTTQTVTLIELMKKPTKFAECSRPM
jgi:hypothetical protein